MFRRQKTMRARYMAKENENAAKARNFLNFPQPGNLSWKKEPMGLAMLPRKVNGRVACFVTGKGKVLRLRYTDGDQQFAHLMDDNEYLITYIGKELKNAQNL